MARRYTIADTITSGSSTEIQRTAISDRQSANDLNHITNPKGFSDRNRLKLLFPKSPIHSNGQEFEYDNFAVKQMSDTIDTFNIRHSTDFNESENDGVFMNFNHPNAPTMTQALMNKPIDTESPDRPFYGHPNLQVNSINPTDPRSSEEIQLRDRNNNDGGFGRRNSIKNYANSVANRGTIGTYFSNVYSYGTESINDNSNTNNLSKNVSAGTSTISISSNNPSTLPIRLFDENN